MKIKLGQLVDSLGALREFSELKMPAKSAFELSKLIEVSQEHLNKLHETAIKNAANLDEKEIKELLDLEIEIPDVQIDIARISGNISAASVSILKWLIR